jgi:hypothetical protein
MIRLFVLGLAVAGSAVAVAPPASAAPPKGCDSSQVKLDERSAVAEARRCQKRIEVLDQRSERSRTFAAADGSMVLESSAVPKRIKRGDGSWADLDSTLRKQSDGTYAPTVAQTTARLSAGGNRTLVSVPTPVGTWQLDWPAVLPAAQVAGDTATYAEVLPGVDLKVRALADGFSYVLVVKTRDALRSPALQRIAMAAKGPAVRAAGDHLEVVGTAGAAVLTSGVATAWDSSGGSGVDGPADTAKISRVGLGIQGGDVVLTPDAGWLADPSLRLPVYVDPQWSSGYQKWTYSNSSNFTYSDLGGVARVGHNPDSTGGNWREHFEFPYGTMAGSIIKAVSLKSTLVHSYSCTAVQADLWRTADVGGTGRTAWTPTPYIQLSAASGHAHKPSEGGSCANDPQPNQDLYFNGGANNFMSQAQAWADQGLSKVTLTLIAHSESSSSNWMKFSPGSTSFIVNYNRRPDTPDPATMTTVGTSQTVACWTGDSSGQQWMNVTNGVTLRANVTDSDVNPGGGGDTVVARFEWQDVTAGTPITTLPDTPGFPSLPWAPHTFTADVSSAALPVGHSVQWRVRGWDGQDLGSYSPWCRFGVDNGTPSQPLITSTDLPPFPATPPATTKVGQTASATLSPGGGDTDVVGYFYSVTTVANPSMPTMYVAATANGTVTIPVVPLASGLAKTFLSVVAVDVAGNRSPVAADAANQPGVRQFRANPADPATHVANDATGDGRADLTVLSDVGGGKSVLWRWDSTPSGGGLATAVAPQGNAGIYVNGGSRTVAGDFDGDGLSDTATFTQSGSDVLLSVQRSDRNQLLSTPVLQTMTGWTISRMQTAGGDFNGDGKADIAVAYDMGSVNWNAYVLLSTSTPGAVSIDPPAAWYQYPAGYSDPSHVKFLAGDFNGDGRCDIAEFYDYGAAQTKLWVHWSQANNTFTAANLQWDSGPNAWFWADSKFVAGDFTGDGRTDLAAVYAPNHTFNGTVGSSFFFARTDGTGVNGPVGAGWSSAANTWDWTLVNPQTGDYDGDGKTDLAILYGCCGPYQASVYTLTSTGTTLGAPVPRWQGGIGPVGAGNLAVDTTGTVKYQFVNVNSGKCLDIVNSGTGNGTAAQQLTCNSAAANQLFTATRVGAVNAYLKPTHTTGQCLAIPGGSTADNAYVGIWSCIPTPDQFQQLEYVTGTGNNTIVRIRPTHSNKCFAIPAGQLNDGAPVVQWTCGPIPDQTWYLKIIP